MAVSRKESSSLIDVNQLLINLTQKVDTVTQYETNYNFLQCAPLYLGLTKKATADAIAQLKANNPQFIDMRPKTEEKKTESTSLSALPLTQGTKRKLDEKKINPDDDQEDPHADGTTDKSQSLKHVKIEPGLETSSSSSTASSSATIKKEKKEEKQAKSLTSESKEASRRLSDYKPDELKKLWLTKENELKSLQTKLAEAEAKAEKELENLPIVLRIHLDRKHVMRVPL